MGRPRPCPWFGCKYNLLVDVTENGTIIFNAGVERIRYGERSNGHPHVRTISRRPTSVSTKYNGRRHKELLAQGEKALFDRIREAVENEEELPSCLLDIVEGGNALTLEEVGETMSVTRERVRQVEVKALVALKRDPDKAGALSDWSPRE